MEIVCSRPIRDEINLKFLNLEFTSWTTCYVFYFFHIYIFIYLFIYFIFHLLCKQSGLGTEGLYGLSNYGKIDGGWTRLKF